MTARSGESSCGVAGHRRIVDDMHRFKADLKAARRRCDAQAVLIGELNRERLAERLQGRLLRVEDFDTFVGLENVTDPAGRVDWARVDAEVTALTRRRPELAPPPADVV